ncbi:MAG: hypothetical protein QM769_07375 [Pseudoxanthomonas sp.]
MDKIETGVDPAEACRALQDAVKAFEILIDMQVSALIARCRAERHELRAAIAQRSQGRQDFSQLIMTYRLINGYADVYWARIYYLKGDRKARFKRLKSSDGQVHLAALSKGAHPDEVALIRSHENQARKFRKLWSTFVEARRKAQQTIKALERALQEGEADGGSGPDS